MGYLRVLLFGAFLFAVVHGQSFYQDQEDDDGALLDYIGSDAISDDDANSDDFEQDGKCIELFS